MYSQCIVYTLIIWHTLYIVNSNDRKESWILNEKLKSEMKKQNISAYRLAKSSNIALPDMYSALKGDKPFYPNWKKRISETLGVPVKELFGGE